VKKVFAPFTDADPDRFGKHGALGRIAAIHVTAKEKDDATAGMRTTDPASVTVIERLIKK
jgi:hypothetical protein